MEHKIILDESQRQVVLLALAELSIARPGWLSMLERVALKMDNRTAEGQAEMFEGFRRNHSNPVAERLSKDPVGFDPDPAYPAQDHA